MDYNRRSNNARWATEDEIKSSLLRISLNDDSPRYGGIPLFADSEAVYVDPTDTHSLIIGSTGSKKTRLIGMPALQLYAKAGESFIATDPKAELYERTLSLLKEKGYRIFVLNLRDPKNSNGWNPLTVPYRLYKSGERDKAVELVSNMADCMVKEGCSREPYWNNSATDLLRGLILTLFECAEEDEIHFKSLRALRNQAFRIHSRENGEGIPFIQKQFLERLDKSAFVAPLLSGSAEVCDVTRGCIVSTFDQAMSPFFGQNNLVDLLSGNDLDMGEIGKEKTAVFLITPDENTLYHKLVSVFVKQCYTELILAAQKRPDKKLSRRVNFLLDEFATLPQINDFPAMITASRSRNIRFSLLMQSMSQLHQRYGAEAETIKGNCENWVFLYSREVPLLEEIINMSGTKRNKQPLVSMLTLQTLSKEKGEAFVLHKRLCPFITSIPDIDCYPGITLGDAKNILSDIQVHYPVNTRKAEAVFDFKWFCDEYQDEYYPLLFTDRKPLKPPVKDEEYYMTNSNVMYEPIFTSHVPSDKELEESSKGAN